jgi:epsin
VSAKELTSLILDEERLRAERRDRKSWKSRVSGLNEFDSEPPKPARKREPRAKTDEEDLELRLAIEASKTEAEEAKRRAAKTTTNDDDDDLAKAIKLSKEEEDLRKRELEEANANSLFDDTPAPQPAAVNNTGWNQGYQQQPTVDWFGNVIDPQAQQNTGYPTAQSGYYVPQQNTSFIPQQQTAFQMNGGLMNNPYSQQPNGMGMLGAMQSQPQLSTQPQEAAVQPGSNNPWAGSTTAGLDVNRPMATGSNNPFAANRPHSAQAVHHPTLNTLQEQKTTTAFNPIMNFSGGSPSSSIPMPEPLTSSMSTLSSMSSSQQSQLQLQQQQQQQQQQLQLQMQQAKAMDPHAARLNALLAANDSGLDTFGNVGDTRIPAQHTAPSAFVNSAGLNLGRLTGQGPGAAGSANPFMAGQFTGMPQTRVPPAQTGPGNPFGAGRQQSGNLIDL